MQLFGGMFSTAAWSIATMVLLTLTSTALPTAPSDGLIHPRSDTAGTLIRRTDEDAQNREAAGISYIQCVARWARDRSPAFENPLREGLALSEKALDESFRLAESECFRQTVEEFGVEPKRTTRADVERTLELSNDIFDVDFTGSDRIRRNLRKKKPGDNSSPDTGGQGRGGGPNNINRMTLIRPLLTRPGILESMKSAFRIGGTGGQYRGAPFGGPRLRAMPVVPR